MIDFKDISHRLRKARRARGLTQEEVAENAGLSVAYIGQIERSEWIPSLKSLFRIIDSLEIPSSEIFHGLCESENHRGYENQSDDIFRENKSLFLDEISEIFDRHFLVSGKPGGQNADG
ncbi:MAG TPA: helix-turn-helix transcriptional regulator [Alphaproteobacteria bacterium]|nr:helix-turn-helix transcriptional regulator [Alphaproteobacteria bacterium]